MALRSKCCRSCQRRSKSRPVARGCADMQRGPIGPLCMSAAKIVQQLTDGNFASAWINGFDGGLVVCVRDGKFPAVCGLRQAITLTIHRQDVDVVGQPVEK